jgi:hypothetical protein
VVFSANAETARKVTSWVEAVWAEAVWAEAAASRAAKPAMNAERMMNPPECLDRLLVMYSLEYNQGGGRLSQS